MRKLIGNKIGNVVNLIIDGNAYQKTFESQDEANAFFKLMHKARGGDDTAFNDILIELNRKYKTVIKGILERDADDNYFLKGIDIKMPELLANTFVDYLNNDFPVTALVNFWKLLVINPDKRVREDLFKFLQEYNFAITDNGYFIAYKAVEVKQAATDDLAAFVSNQYLKIKTWKKNPANYSVYRLFKFETSSQPNPDFEIADEVAVDGKMYDDGEPEYIEVTKKVFMYKLVEQGHALPDGWDMEISYGSLANLFKNIDQLVDNRSIYQSKYSGAKGKVEQVLGEPVKMDRVDTNLDPRVECSSGLHVGSTKYVEKFGSNTDDKILLVLVNPANVVAVPEYDNSKIRTCEYFPYAELERLDGNKFEVVEAPYFEEDYMKYERIELEKEIDRIQAEIESQEVKGDNKVQLDYKKILEDRLVAIEKIID